MNQARSRLPSRPGLLLTTVALACLCAPARAGGDREALAAAIARQRPGAPLPQGARFRDERGRTASLGALGDWPPLLIVPVYYRCTSLCPTIVHGLATQLRSLSLRPGSDYQVVVYSIDPADGPSAAAMARGSVLTCTRGAAAGWHFWTGSAGAIAALSGALGVRYRRDRATGEYAHPSVLAIAARGRLTRLLPGIADADQIRLAIAEAGQGRSADVFDQVLLRCYHFDPRTGRYTLVVMRIVRVIGLLSIALLLLLIAGATRKRA